MFKIKGIKLVLICLLVTLSASCFSLLFVNAYSSFTKPEEPQAAAEAYNLNVAIQGGNIDDYYNHSEFLIATNNAFANFQDLVNGTAYGINQCMDFYGKTVKLTTDLDFSYHTKRDKSGALLGTFAGSFDGQGHTLSNITHTVDTINSNVFSYFLLEGKYVNRTYYYAGSFASVLQGVVKNTRFKNTRVYIEPSKNFPVYVGVVAGMLWSGSVYDCIVENVNFYSNLDHTQLCVSPLVGGVLARYFILSDGGILTYQPTAFEPNITDCIVLGNIFMAGHDWNLLGDGDDDGMYLKYICCDDNFITWTNELATQLNIAAGNNTQINDGYNIKRIIFDAKITVQEDEEYDELGHCYKPGEGDNFTNNIGTIYSFDSAYKSGSFDSYSWHKYKSGYSYQHDNDKTYNIWLKAFIDWQVITFEAINCTIDPVKSDFGCPGKYKDVTYNGPKVTVYGTTFTATANDGCNTPSWSATATTDGLKLTAKSNALTYSIRFVPPILESTNEEVEDVEFNSAYYSTLEPNYGDILYVTYDSVNETITYKVSDYSDRIYTLPKNKYEVVSFGSLGNIKITNGITLQNLNGTSFRIQPELKLKETNYRLTFNAIEKATMTVDGVVETTKVEFKALPENTSLNLIKTERPFYSDVIKFTYRFNDGKDEHEVVYEIEEEYREYFSFKEVEWEEVILPSGTTTITPELEQIRIEIRMGDPGRLYCAEFSIYSTKQKYTDKMENSLDDTWYDIEDNLANNNEFKFKPDDYTTFIWVCYPGVTYSGSMNIEFSEDHLSLTVWPNLESIEHKIIVTFNAPRMGNSNGKELSSDYYEVITDHEDGWGEGEEGKTIELQILENIRFVARVQYEIAIHDPTKLRYNIITSGNSLINPKRSFYYYQFKIDEMFEFVIENADWEYGIEYDETNLKITITPIVTPLKLAVNFNNPVKEDGSQFEYDGTKPEQIVMDYVADYTSSLQNPVIEEKSISYNIAGTNYTYSMENELFVFCDGGIEYTPGDYEINITPKIRQKYVEVEFDGGSGYNYTGYGSGKGFSVFIEIVEGFRNGHIPEDMLSWTSMGSQELTFYKGAIEIVECTTNSSSNVFLEVKVECNDDLTKITITPKVGNSDTVGIKFLDVDLNKDGTPDVVSGFSSVSYTIILRESIELGDFYKKELEIKYIYVTAGVPHASTKKYTINSGFEEYVFIGFEYSKDINQYSQVEATPILSKKLTFNNSSVGNVAPDINGNSGTDENRTLLVKDDYVLTPSELQTTELKFTFTNYDGNDVTVVYTSELYVFTDLVINRCTITPIDEQKYVKLSLTRYEGEDLYAYTYNGDTDLELVEVLIDITEDFEAGNLQPEGMLNIEISEDGKKITFKAKRDGQAVSVSGEIKTGLNYKFKDAGFDSGNSTAKEIIYSPTLEESLKTIVFNNSTVGNVAPTQNGVELENRTLYMRGDSNLTSSTSNNDRTLTFTFINESGAETTITYESDLFKFINAGITASADELTITITPVDEQAYIYLEFATISFIGDTFEPEPESGKTYIIDKNYENVFSTYYNRLTFVYQKGYTFTTIDAEEITIYYQLMYIYDIDCDLTNEEIAKLTENGTKLVITPKISLKQCYLIIEANEKYNCYKDNSQNALEPSNNLYLFTIDVIGEYSVDDMIKCESDLLGTNEIKFETYYNGAKQTIKLVADPRYIFTNYAINTDDVTEILLTPTIVEAKTVKFEDSNVGNKPTHNGVELANRTFYLKGGETVQNIENELTYTFTNSENAEIEIKYNYSNIYTIVDYGIVENGSQIIVTPELEQIYLNVIFVSNSNYKYTGLGNTDVSTLECKIDLMEDKEPEEKITHTEFGTNILTFTTFKDGETIKIECKITTNKYVFSEVEISLDDSNKTITVTPKYVDASTKLIFNITTNGNILPKIGEVNVTGQEFKLKYSTNITSSGLGTTELTFSFTDTNNETVVVKYSSELYVFTDAGIGEEVDREIQITPLVSQAYIYVQFNNATTGTHTATLTGATAGTKTKIDVGSLATIGLNTNVLTLSPTLDGVTKTVTYTTIENAYIFTAVGIVSVDAEHIQVTPVLNSTLKQVTFAEIEKATEVATGTYTVKNNTAITVTLNAAKNVLTFKFNAFNSTTNAVESKEVTYTSHELYIFSSAGWENNAPITEYTTITPTVSQKYINVTFNNATTGTHTATLTGATAGTAIKVDINTLNSPAVGGHTLTFTATLDGVTKTVTYTTIANAYEFTASGITTVDAENISVTPVLGSVLRQLTFADIDKATGVATATYTVKNNTTISVNLNAAKNVLIFTFKAFNEITKEDETKTVRYTSEELYTFSSAGWEDGVAVTADTTITPVLVQTYVYVTFNNATTDTHTATLTGAIAGTAIKVDINTLVEPTGLNTNVLTFSPTLDGATKTVTYTTIANAYEFTASGITTVDAENISVTPVLGSVLRQVTFANIDKATKEATDTYTVKNNTTISVSLNAANNVLTFTFNAFNTTTNADKSETVTYTSYELYIFSSAGWEDGAAVTTDTTITPVLVQTYVYVTFNNATTDTHTVTPTGAIAGTAIKVDINTLVEPTGLNTNVLTFSPTLDGATKTVTYTTIANAYEFTASGITTVDAENISVTPVLGSVLRQLTFADIDKATKEATDTYTVKNNTTISVNLNAANNVLTFTFNAFNTTTNADESETVRYTSEELYTFSSAGWEDGAAVTTDTTITPVLVQTYVYLIFTSTTGDYVANPSSTERYIIEYNNGSPTIGFNVTTNEYTNNTVTYTFTDISSGETSVTYTIACVYTTEDSKTPSEDNETITVAPITTQTYMIIEFLQTTGSLSVSPSVVQYRVDYESSGIYNITSEFVNNGLFGHVLTYKYNGSGVSAYTIPAENAIHIYKTETIDIETTKITVTPELEQKYVFLEFKPTTGDLIVSQTGKYLIEASNWSTNLICTDEILINTKIYYTFADYLGTSQKVEYTDIPNIYTLNSEGITGDTTNVVVEPVLEHSYVNIQFKETSINTRTYYPSITIEFLIDKDSLSEEPNESYLEAETKIEYTATKDGEGITVTYGGIDPIYTYGSTTRQEEFLESGILSKIIITPVLEQTYIYVKFNDAEINGSVFTPTETEKFKIEYKSGNYTIESEFVEDGVNNGTLTYTLNETEKEVVYSIHAAYTIKSDGITAVDVENIEITPVLEQAYILVTFGKTTGEAEISPNETNQIKVRYNSGNYISDGVINWTNCTLSYEVILADGSFKTITYTINPRAKYTFDKDFIPNEPSNVEEVTISPTLILKMYDVGFGKA